MIDVDSSGLTTGHRTTHAHPSYEQKGVRHSCLKLAQTLAMYMGNFVCGNDFKQVHLSYLDERLREFDITRGGYATSEEIQNHQICKHKEIYAPISDIH